MFKSVAILALAATTLAHPGRRSVHHHHHHNFGTGTGGIAAPTGGIYPQNGTGAYGAGSSSAVVSVITATVVPLPASNSASPADQLVDTSSSMLPVAAEDTATSPSCSSTITSTYTSMNYVTVTVSSGTSTSTVAAAVNEQSYKPSPVASSVVSPVATSATSSTSDSPAGFFQRPSQPGGYTNYGSSTTTAAATTFATSVAASSVVASSAAPSSSAAPISSGSTGGKKGLSYNSAALTDAFSGTGMSWAYNWAATQSGSLVSGVEYVPMLWGLDSVGAWAGAAQTAISSGSTAALSFNEPDLSTQSNIDPATAATNHIKYMNPLSVEVGSPAITNGAGTSPLMGIDWLNAFFTACAGKCKVDFVAFHWYSDASDTAYFKQHVTDVITAAAANGVNKVWLTEFGTTGGDTESFLQEVMPFLDSTPQVEKYAFFMCGAPQTLSGSTLNSVGQVYAST